MSASTSPLPYTGNKSCIVNTILTVMPKHNVYIEPCMGSAEVFFRKPKAEREMLKALRNKLLDHLGNLCGKCDGCVQYGGKCWAKELEDQVVRVPDWAKKAAGIPLDANLVCAIDDCCIRIYKNRDNQGISDIPAEIISAFHANKLCIGGLYERVLSGEIVYSEGDKQ